MDVATHTPTADGAALVAEAARGGMVVLRESVAPASPGALLIPAAHATAEAIAFMAREARGLICLALTPERVHALRLPLLPATFSAGGRPPFTVSIEAREGVTTGISAFDRAATIAAAIDPACGAEDLVTPGHVFPLVAAPGGVLARAGLVEAAVDLGWLSGTAPAGVLCLILDEDGDVARGATLDAFAAAHSLPLGTTEALVRHRLALGPRVLRRAAGAVTDEAGASWQAVVFAEPGSEVEHLALLLGDPRTDDLPVYLHRPAPLLSVFDGAGFLGLHTAMGAMRDGGVGAVLCLDMALGEGLAVALRLAPGRPREATPRPAAADLALAMLANLGVVAPRPVGDLATQILARQRA